MLATFGDNSGEKRQQTLNNYIKGALSSPLFHLSFVCFMCFTSFRTNPSSPLAAAAKYRSCSSGNVFLSSCSSFFKALACFFFPGKCRCAQRCPLPLLKRSQFFTNRPPVRGKLRPGWTGRFHGSFLGGGSVGGVLRGTSLCFARRAEPSMKPPVFPELVPPVVRQELRWISLPSLPLKAEPFSHFRPQMNQTHLQTDNCRCPTH